jgi:hypothetical protein
MYLYFPLSYLRTWPLCPLRIQYQPLGAGPYLSIWLGAVDIYAPLCFGPIWLLPVTLLVAIYVTRLTII